MADTGAPWNIPFATPTNLVRGWPALSEDVADAVVDALDAGALEFATVGSDTVDLDFATNKVLTRSATGAVTFTGSNYTEGRSVTVRIVAGASNRNLTFPAAWRFVSNKPTSILADKVGVLAVTSFGTTAGDAVAAFAVEF
jgi:hypothetical protein